MAIDDPILAVDDPIRGNGGVKGFGFDFPASAKTAQVDGKLRVTPDPAVKITMLRITQSGTITHEIVVGGEWEIAFLP